MGVHAHLDAKTGMSVWWRDHADHHMEKLFAGASPFKACSVHRGHKTSVQPLPTDKAPDALFPDQRETRTTNPHFRPAPGRPVRRSARADVR
ncbi:DUF4913 domain-containing protein [Rhodococcus sp. DN22]|uniref:DUF4913 domain-containing protein n=1 Tax=Rhodococcus sp. DN22 TaxID=357684 RepID=UPI0030CBFB9A